MPTSRKGAENMPFFLVKLRSRALRTATLAAALALTPIWASGQEVAATETVVVTDLYELESLLPDMPSGELDSVRNIASWCLEMSRVFDGRLAEARTRIDFQRDLKKVEIKGLEVRQKAAGKAKDDESRKALEAEVKVQKAELDVLNAIKDVADQEQALVKDLEAAGKVLRGLAGDFDGLAGNRSSARRAWEKAKDQAEQAGLPAPALVIGYGANDKAMRSIGDAGKDLKGLGDRLMKLAKARQGLVGAWERMEKTKAER